MGIFSKNISTYKALFYSDKQISFVEIDNYVNILVEHFSLLRINSKIRIGILLGNVPGFLASILAVDRMNASCVLFQTSFKHSEILEYIKETQISYIVTDRSHEELLAKLNELIHFEVKIIQPLFGELLIYSVFNEDVIFEKDEDEFILQFTSGVNGKSKIVIRSYQNLENEIVNFSHLVKFKRNDCVICPVPIYHAYGLLNGFLAPYYNNTQIVLLDSFFPSEFVEKVNEYKPTMMVGNPVIYNILSRTDYIDVNMSSLILCFSAGAKISPDIVRKFQAKYNLEIVSQYGTTETGAICINLKCTSSKSDISVGHAINGFIVKIVNEEGGIVKKGNEGRILVKGKCVSKGYLKNPELTKSKFKNNYYDTEDIGWLDNDNNLYITGRNGAFINIGGMKIDPCEIENVLLKHRSVKECAVIGQIDADYYESINAYVVSEHVLSVKELKSFCHKYLTDYKIPKYIQFMEELPKTPTGKILKKYLLNE